jgi:hypothetical protein
VLAGGRLRVSRWHDKENESAVTVAPMLVAPNTAA